MTFVYLTAAETQLIPPTVGKIIGVLGILLSAVLMVLIYKCFSAAIRHAALNGKTIYDIPKLIYYFLPWIYLGLQEFGVCPFTIPDKWLPLVIALCYIMPTIGNLWMWGLRKGPLFAVCQITISLVAAVALASIAFAAVLGIALVVCAAMSVNQQGGYLIISENYLGGDDILVAPIGSDIYQDGNLNTYHRMNSDHMLGSDGRVYYIKSSL